MEAPNLKFWRGTVVPRRPSSIPRGTHGRLRELVDLVTHLPSTLMAKAYLRSSSCGRSGAKESAFR
jgi:hypothetical protein